RGEVVLERVADVAVLELDPALPIDAPHAILAQELVQQRVEVRVAGEDDVARDVPGVALLVLEARRQAADLARALVHLEVVDAALPQAVARPEPGWAGAQDDDAAQRVATTRFIASACRISPRSSKR